jgi:transcriptional regulator with XRE-family HTH domain
MTKKKEVKEVADEKLGSNPFLVEIGRRVKKLRVEAGMTQEHLGNAAGVSSAYIYLTERGRQNMTLSVFRRIAEGLDAPIEDLLSDAELQATPTDRSVHQLVHVVDKLNEMLSIRNEQDKALIKEVEKVAASHEQLMRFLKEGAKGKPTR